MRGSTFSNIAVFIVQRKPGLCKIPEAPLAALKEVGIRGAPAPVREVPDATAWEPLKQILQQWDP